MKVVSTWLTLPQVVSLHQSFLEVGFSASIDWPKSSVEIWKEKKALKKEAISDV